MRKASLATTALTVLVVTLSLSVPAYAGEQGGEGGENGCEESCGGGGGDITVKPIIVNAPTNKAYGGDGGDAKAYGGDAKAYGGDAKAHSEAEAKARSDAHASVDNVGNVNIDNERPPVNTAYSAALAVGEDTCMGSSSIGGQAVSFGLTIGTTWTDDNCQRLKNSRQLVALGYHRAATSLMCFNDDVRAAMDQAGTPCPSGPAIYVAPPPPPEREYVPMAPVPDHPVKRKRRKLLPPK